MMDWMDRLDRFDRLRSNGHHAGIDSRDMEAAGYPSVAIRRDASTMDLLRMQVWLNANVPDGFYWCDGRIWFTSLEDATMFALSRE